MNVGEAIREAFASLAANRLRSALTMLGVVIGVGAVILLVSLGEGADAFVRSEFAGIGTNLIMVQPGKQSTTGGPPAPATTRRLTLRDAEAVRRDARFVEAVVPVTIGSGVVEREGYRRNVMVLGVDASWSKVFNVRAERGQFFDEGADVAERRVVVIGPKVAAELFGDADPLGGRIEVAGGRFRVIGVTDPKGSTLGMDFDDIVYIPVSVSFRLFGVDSLFGLRAKAVSNELLGEASREIKRVLRERHGVDDFTVITQDELMKTLSRILDVLTILLASIAAVSLLVGGIGIMNIMLVTVKERTREIGLRKAIGARRRDILVQFLVESATLSLFGGAVGLALGVGIPLVAHLVAPSFPAVVAPWAVVLALVFSLVVGIFFGVYPALQAARLRPVEALRYD